MERADIIEKIKQTVYLEMHEPPTPAQKAARALWCHGVSEKAFIEYKKELGLPDDWHILVANALRELERNG